jgi:hypothetical protein
MSFNGGILYLGGRFVAETPDNKLHVFAPSTFTLSSAPTVIEAKGFPKGSIGKKGILASAVSELIWTMSMDQEFTDGIDIQMLVDQKAAVNASIALPKTQLITVPSGSPYTVTVTGLLADQDVVATVLGTSPLYLTRVLAAATPAAGEFEVNADAVAFNAAQAGASVLIRYLKTYSTISIIGGTNADSSYGTLSFSGEVLGSADASTQGKTIYIPQVDRVSGATLGVTGAVVSSTLEYRCSTPSGWAVPFAIVDRDLLT